MLNFLGVGWGEGLVILLVAFLAFGPKRLPELARQIGRSLHQLQRGWQDLKDELGKKSDR